MNWSTEHQLFRRNAASLLAELVCTKAKVGHFKRQVHSELINKPLQSPTDESWATLQSRQCVRVTRGFSGKDNVRWIMHGKSFCLYHDVFLFCFICYGSETKICEQINEVDFVLNLLSGDYCPVFRYGHPN